MTARASIGGQMGYAAYALLAQRHKPADLSPEIRRLHGSGLTPQDISIALRLPLDQVINTINPVGIDSSPAVASPAASVSTGLGL